MKKIIVFGLVFFLFLLIPSSAFQISSTSYAIKGDINEGGKTITSSSYKIFESVSQVFAINNTNSTNYVGCVGLWCVLSVVNKSVVKYVPVMGQEPEFQTKNVIADNLYAVLLPIIQIFVRIKEYVYSLVAGV